jgi:nucleoid DNA-binding protein
VLKLQERGFLFREAWRVVNAILDVMIEELQYGGSVVLERLLGKFKVVRRPAARRLVRFGREVVVNQEPKRVAFRMDQSLRSPLPSLPASEEVCLPEAIDPKQLRCERCGSLEFTEVQFRQYLAEFSSASPGGDLMSRTEEPFRVLVCLCGNPVMPRQLRSYGRTDRESFRKSFEAARR